MHEIRESGLRTADQAWRHIAPLCGEITVERFIEEAAKRAPFDSYKVFPQAAHALVAEVVARGGVEAGRVFLRAAIARAAADTVQSDRFKHLPARVLGHQTHNLRRMAADDDVHASWLDLNNDIFQKEFGMATLRLYAAAAQVIDARCGVPRSMILKGGLTGIVPTLFAMLKMGGFKPFFQVHTHKFNLHLFTEKNREECYLCCVDLYEQHPEVLGMFGCSWFYDPALDAISPHLAYLSKTPLAYGARRIVSERGGDAIASAIATSATRRKLYEDSAYLPTTYMLLWGKKEQLAWARSYAGSASPS